jgi:hypothetical protein
MSDDVKRALDEAIERILASKSPKKLVVAGPVQERRLYSGSC